MKRFRNAMLATAFLSVLSQGVSAGKRIDYQAEIAAGPKGAITFTPPSDEQIPEGRDMIRYGQDLYVNTDNCAANTPATA